MNWLQSDKNSGVTNKKSPSLDSDRFEDLENMVSSLSNCEAGA